MFLLWRDCPVYCVLCPVYCILCLVHCVLCTVYCVPCTVCCVLCPMHCVLCTAYFVPCTVCCVLCAVCCVLCTVRCVLCPVYCVLCTVAYCILWHIEPLPTRWQLHPPILDVKTKKVSRHCQISPGGQNWTSQIYSIFIYMIFEQLSSLRREGRRQLTSMKHLLHSRHGIRCHLTFVCFQAPEWPGEAGIPGFKSWPPQYRPGLGELVSANFCFLFPL